MPCIQPAWVGREVARHLPLQLHMLRLPTALPASVCINSSTALAVPQSLSAALAIAGELCRA